MHVLTIAMTLALGIGPQTPAQQPKPCSTPEYRQFDFWIGDWDVYDPQGKLAGHNRIESAQGGCAVVEHWTAVDGSTGTSLNFYDHYTHHWYQAWMGQSGGALRLTGGFENGAMAMSSDPSPRPDGKIVIHKITWTPLGNGHVRQFWQTSTDNGKTWGVSFDGTYTKRT